MADFFEESRRKVLEAEKRFKEEAGEDILISRQELLVYLLFRKWHLIQPCNQYGNLEYGASIDGKIDQLEDVIEHVKNMTTPKS